MDKPAGGSGGANVEDDRRGTIQQAADVRLPKWFNYNHTEPPRYPFVGGAPNHWDFTKFNPEYFQHFERRIAEVGAMGIEADVILFHPYDEGHWGFDNMGADNDDRYLRYVIARLGAYRHVWWSLANEWDYFKTKKETDFERFGEIIAKDDPYKHVCSIHQQKVFFDHTKPWISHVSVQNDMPDNAPMYTRKYAKPVVFDECRYEGDIPEGWGDITAERLIGNFWKTLVEGAFCGHGETFLNATEELRWAKGGVMVGRMPERGPAPEVLGADGLPNPLITRTGPGTHAYYDPPIHEAALVTINGQPAGALWHPLYRLDVTKFLHAGVNHVEFHVFNTALNAWSALPPRNYGPLIAKYGDRFQMQDLNQVMPISSGLLGDIRLVTEIR